jgi:hypothetical protein
MALIAMTRFWESAALLAPAFVSLVRLKNFGCYPQSFSAIH